MRLADLDEGQRFALLQEDISQNPKRTYGGEHKGRNSGEASKGQLDKGTNYRKSRPNVTELSFPRLTDKEVAKKKARNECFRCNEKFHPGHKCKQGQFHRIELVPHLESSSSGDEAEEGECSPEEHPIISIHALTGILSHKTMMVGGMIGGRRVNILMDSGSTHNFLNESWVEKNV